MGDDRFLIKNVALNGETPPLDVLVAEGKVQALGNLAVEGIPGINGEGAALIPGLHDHHIHLYATAAAMNSLSLPTDKITTYEDLGLLLSGRNEAENSLRVINYNGPDTELLDRWALDKLIPDRPLRVQYRTGSLWVLNSCAIEAVLEESAAIPECFELDSRGRVNGRLWRADAWLRAHDRRSPPSLESLSRQLARYGCTGVTEASYTNDQQQVNALCNSIHNDNFLQSVSIMGQPGLVVDGPDNCALGPVKIMLDESRLPTLESLANTICLSHDEGRNVAAHCVTVPELVFYLSALEVAGVMPGDRVEHGSLIPEGIIDSLAEMDMTVVTQPAFVVERGSMYCDKLAEEEINDLYRCASLMRRGIKVAGSSDAPYSSFNPWAAIDAATHRTIKTGRVLGFDEILSYEEALALFLGDAYDPGGPIRKVDVGVAANLCLLKPPHQRDPLDPVSATVIDGKMIYCATSTRDHCIL